MKPDKCMCLCSVCHIQYIERKLSFQKILSRPFAINPQFQAQPLVCFLSLYTACGPLHVVLFIQHNDSEMNVRYSSFFLLGRSHCTDRLQFVSRLPADGDLGRFQFGALMHYAAVLIQVQGFVWMSIYIFSLGEIPKSRLGGKSMWKQSLLKLSWPRALILGRMFTNLYQSKPLELQFTENTGDGRTN